MAHRIAVAALIFTLSAASSVEAQMRLDEPPSAPPTLEVEWYGWQILTTDLAAVLMTGLGMAIGDDEDGIGTDLFVLGVTAYLVGGPSMHFSRDRLLPMVLSTATRLAAPFLAYALFDQLAGPFAAGDPEPGQWAMSTAVGASLLSGIALASLVDSLFLSWDAYLPAPTQPRIEPVVSVDAHAAALGVQGVF